MRLTFAFGVTMVTKLRNCNRFDQFWLLLFYFSLSIFLVINVWNVYVIIINLSLWLLLVLDEILFVANKLFTSLKK